MMMNKPYTSPTPLSIYQLSPHITKTSIYSNTLLFVHLLICKTSEYEATTSRIITLTANLDLCCPDLLNNDKAKLYDISTRSTHSNSINIKDSIIKTVLIITFTMIFIIYLLSYTIIHLHNNWYPILSYQWNDILVHILPIFYTKLQFRMCSISRYWNMDNMAIIYIISLFILQNYPITFNNSLSLLLLLIHLIPQLNITVSINNALNIIITIIHNLMVDLNHKIATHLSIIIYLTTYYYFTFNYHHIPMIYIFYFVLCDSYFLCFNHV